MLTFLKTMDFWLIVSIALAVSGGCYLMGYSVATDKAMNKISAWKDEQSRMIQESMQNEHRRQMNYIEQREPAVQKEIHYLDRVVTEYEQIINSSSDRCVMPPDRVRGYNAIGKTPADQLLPH